MPGFTKASTTPPQSRDECQSGHNGYERTLLGLKYMLYTCMDLLGNGLENANDYKLNKQRVRYKSVFLQKLWLKNANS